jgi:uncharacterized membrane protein
MTNLTATKGRIQSIDVLRGIVMVIMALDHVRDFFYKANVQDASTVATDPTNMASTYPALFFTRWITHFCAPVFLFLSGVSIWIMSGKKTKKELSLFLIKRGFWLVLVELFIIGLGWTFDPLYHVFILQVIWAIGISMILLGLLVWLPYTVLLALGILFIAGHNIMDYPSVYQGLKGNTLSDFIYFGAFKQYTLGNNRVIFLVYAFLPWTAIMLLGYCFGKIYDPQYGYERRRKILMTFGVLLTVGFILLRFSNLYGDPVPWSKQPRGSVFTFLSFLNLNKYPPSLLFICMTLGPGFITLALLEKWSNRFTAIMNIYGRVPMFYYILHFYFIHIIAVVIFYASGYTSRDIITPGNPFLFRPPSFGVPLWGVYSIWMIVVVALYPLCRKYNRYKSTHTHWWLSYI